MARKERILVQRLDHNCDPVLDSFLIFHTAPARSGQFRRNRKTSLLTLYHVPLTRRIWVCRSSLLSWAKFKDQSRRSGCSSSLRTRFLFRKVPITIPRYTKADNAPSPAFLADVGVSSYSSPKHGGERCRQAVRGGVGQRWTGDQEKATEACKGSAAK